MERSIALTPRARHCLLTRNMKGSPLAREVTEAQMYPYRRHVPASPYTNPLAAPPHLFLVSRSRYRVTMSHCQSYVWLGFCPLFPIMFFFPSWMDLSIFSNCRWAHCTYFYIWLIIIKNSRALKKNLWNANANMLFLEFLWSLFFPLSRNCIGQFRKLNTS